MHRQRLVVVFALVSVGALGLGWQGPTPVTANLPTIDPLIVAEEAHVFASDAAPSDDFGFSVALSGDTAVVGARFDDTPAGANAGSAYVFTGSGTVWTQQQKPIASDGATGDQFGYSVALSGDTAVVGSYLDDTPAGTDAGSAYVFLVPGAPTISSFTPAAASVGRSVTISGTAFDATSGVAFNGVPATTFAVISDVKLTATVPNGALTGLITVTTPVGVATSATTFKVKPTIMSFSPPSGPVGTTVTINGSAFTGATKVTFNGKSAAFTINSYSKITATVPPGATTGRIVVKTAGGSGKSKTDFVVTQ